MKIKVYRQYIVHECVSFNMDVPDGTPIEEINVKVLETDEPKIYNEHTAEMDRWVENILWRKDESVMDETFAEKHFVALGLTKDTQPEKLRGLNESA